MSLEQLREKRRKWVEANRENGFEEGINNLLTQLYPDNAHFIYELLQNAEDTCAKVVQFTLTDSSVEFEHDGERLFWLKDVESITSIGASTKQNDPTSIGKFGVGFKAVFAYTNTPEIHSGDFHFRILDLVVPETDSIPRPKIGKRETRFVFPFDNPKKPRTQAVGEVERGLRALGDNTLLFLGHISKVEYLLPDGSLGSLERIGQNGGRIEIRSNQAGRDETVSHWLRFEKDVEVTDEDGEPKTCRVAIAYHLVEGKDKKDSSIWKIVPLDHGQVSIFFPAEKETSNLRFHIHAPFASTVARDSVRDCKANHELRDHLAKLVVESLTTIRNQGMLTVDFLAVLPNRQDNLSDFYEPIREAIVQAFIFEALTPTKSGSHASAGGLYRGPARIQEVLDDEDLSQLIQREAPLWAKNPPQENQREARFLDSLVIGRWGWGELAKAMSKPHSYAYQPQQYAANDHHKNLIENWIAQKDDAWLMRLYALLGEACDTHDKCVDVSELLIVRVDAARGSEHATPQEAFFPPEQGTIPPPDIRFVKPTVFSTGRSEAQKRSAASFLKNIGVQPFDAKAVIELRLAHYDNPSGKVADGHYKDLEQFIAYWKKNSTDANLFKGRAFLLGVSVDGNLCWRKPTQLCLDDPYENTGLAQLSKIHHKDTVWDSYKKKLAESQLTDFIGFLKAIGVMHDLRVAPVSSNNNPHAHELRRDYRQSGVKWTYTAINEDYSISDIDKYLAMQSVLASRLIWDALIHADAKSAMAHFRPNQQYPTREAESQLVCHLKRHAWIPDKSEVFRKPEEMTKDDLRIDFPYDDRNGLLTAIGFGEQAKQKSTEYLIRNVAATSFGFSSAKEAEELARIIRETGITSTEIRSLALQRQHTSQPEDSVPNPERRRKGVLERRDNAPTKESVTRERTIQPGARPETLEAKAYLRTKYKNSEEQLICQCCHTEMPFKVGDDHYFEAIQCVRGLEQHYFENRLALCPTCAAMYQYARKTDDAELKRRIVEHTASDQASSVEIPVHLAGREYALHFVGTHWFDLKTVLQGK